jgi:hypothetical protein
MDAWTEIQQRPLLNINVASPIGPYFSREIDCIDKMNDASFQFELMKDKIKEIGPSILGGSSHMQHQFVTGLMILTQYQDIFELVVVCMLQIMHSKTLEKFLELHSLF